MSDSARGYRGERLSRRKVVGGFLAATATMPLALTARFRDLQAAEFPPESDLRTVLVGLRKAANEQREESGGYLLSHGGKHRWIGREGEVNSVPFSIIDVRMRDFESSSQWNVQEIERVAIHNHTIRSALSRPRKLADDWLQFFSDDFLDTYEQHPELLEDKLVTGPSSADISFRNYRSGETKRNEIHIVADPGGYWVHRRAVENDAKIVGLTIRDRVARRRTLRGSEWMAIEAARVRMAVASIDDPSQLSDAVAFYKRTMLAFGDTMSEFIPFDEPNAIDKVQRLVEHWRAELQDSKIHAK